MKLAKPFLATGILLATSLTPQLVFGESESFIEGFSQPFRVAKVSAGTSGIVSQLSVDEGASVIEGQCLLRINDEIHTRLLAVAETTKNSQGELAAAQAQLTTVLDRVQTIRGLAARSHATPEELMRAEGELSLAQANLLTVQEKQRLREAEYQKLLAESRNYCIEAPFDGVVIEFLKEKGEFVGPVDPNVCTVAELSTLSADFLVSRIHKDEIVLNAEATILFVDVNREVQGTVYYISPFPDGETNTFTVKIRVDNSDLQLNAGERCELLLSQQRPQESSKSYSANLAR